MKRNKNKSQAWEERKKKKIVQVKFTQQLFHSFVLSLFHTFQCGCWAWAFTKRKENEMSENAFSIFPMLSSHLYSSTIELTIIHPRFLTFQYRKHSFNAISCLTDTNKWINIDNNTSNNVDFSPRAKRWIQKHMISYQQYTVLTVFHWLGGWRNIAHQFWSKAATMRMTKTTIVDDSTWSISKFCEKRAHCSMYTTKGDSMPIIFHSIRLLRVCILLPYARRYYSNQHGENILLVSNVQQHSDYISLLIDLGWELYIYIWTCSESLGIMCLLLPFCSFTVSVPLFSSHKFNKTQRECVGKKVVNNLI